MVAGRGAHTHGRLRCPRDSSRARRHVTHFAWAVPSGRASSAGSGPNVLGLRAEQAERGDDNERHTKPLASVPPCTACADLDGVARPVGPAATDPHAHRVVRVVHARVERPIVRRRRVGSVIFLDAWAAGPLRDNPERHAEQLEDRDDAGHPVQVAHQGRSDRPRLGPGGHRGELDRRAVLPPLDVVRRRPRRWPGQLVSGPQWRSQE